MTMGDRVAVLGPLELKYDGSYAPYTSSLGFIVCEDGVSKNW